MQRALTGAMMGLMIATSVGCGLAVSDPTGERPALPDRAIAPWRREPLILCIDATCEHPAPRPIGFDVRASSERFEVVIIDVEQSWWRGELRPEHEAWVLMLSPLPMAAPPSWAGNGVTAPRFLSHDGHGILVTALNGSAVGRVQLEGVWDAQPWATGTPAFTSAGGGYRDGELWVVSAHGDGRLRGWRGTDSGEPTGLELTVEAFASGDPLHRWDELTRLSDPHLVLDGDRWRLFFAAPGLIAFEGGTVPRSWSVGFAASSDLLSFEPYPFNPVFDHTFAFVLQADERLPAVAVGPAVAVMLYSENRGSGEQLALAVHEVGQ